MSHTARLHIKGHEDEKRGILIKSCEYSFSQKIDNSGMPTSKVKSGLIHISIAKECDKEIIEWMFSENAVKNGKISYLSADDSQIIKTLEFFDGKLIRFKENFDDESGEITYFSISARKIVIGGAECISNWPNYSQE